MITNHVKKLRGELNITQEQLASACGVSRQTVIAIEKGNYTPSLLLALQVAEFFRLPVEKIFQIQN
jgi:putative transcriptional regulator